MPSEEVSDPLLRNANDDLKALSTRLAAELHQVDDSALFKTKMLAILYHYGPSVAEAVLRELLVLAGVPLPLPLPAP